MRRGYMATRELIQLFQTMEVEIIKGGKAKEDTTQPYRTYEGWLSEIEGYIQNVVSGKGIKPQGINMNNFSRKDYEVGQERNDRRNQETKKGEPYLEKKSREERLRDIMTKQTDSNRTRGKGKWLV
jgi:hypothetical protein